MIELPSSPIVLDDIDVIVGQIEPVEEDQQVEVEVVIEPDVVIDQPLSPVRSPVHVYSDYTVSSDIVPPPMNEWVQDGQ